MIVAISRIKVQPVQRDKYSSLDLREVKNSIQEIGLDRNIVVDKNFEIVDGVRRFYAVKELGFKYVWVEVLQYSHSKKSSSTASSSNHQVITSTEQVHVKNSSKKEIKKPEHMKNKEMGQVIRSKENREEVLNRLGLKSETVKMKFVYNEDKKPHMMLNKNGKLVLLKSKGISKKSVEELRREERLAAINNPQKHLLLAG